MHEPFQYSDEAAAILARPCSDPVQEVQDLHDLSAVLRDEKED